MRDRLQNRNRFCIGDIVRQDRKVGPNRKLLDGPLVIHREPNVMEPMVDIVSAPNVKERPGEAGDVWRTDKSFAKGWRDHSIRLKVSVQLDLGRRIVALILREVCEDCRKVVLGRMMGRWAGRKDKLFPRPTGNRLGSSHLEELIPETSLEMDRQHCVGRRETGRAGDARVFALDPFE
jgi:hypothetical protein